MLLSRQARAILKQINKFSGECDFVFIVYCDNLKSMSENAVNKALHVMSYDTKVADCGTGFRATACGFLIE